MGGQTVRGGRRLRLDCINLVTVMCSSNFPSPCDFCCFLFWSYLLAAILLESSTDFSQAYNLKHEVHDRFLEFRCFAVVLVVPAHGVVAFATVVVVAVFDYVVVAGAAVVVVVAAVVFLFW